MEMEFSEVRFDEEGEEMLEIQKNITNVNKTVMNNKQNKYIVVHYTGAEGSAKNNTIYFKNTDRQASAHYFIDETSIWQCVEDKDKAWHCGGVLEGGHHPYRDICTNSNSIGVEMCCKKNALGEWYFEEGTVKNTIELIRSLMSKYNIPIERVIRHYDVTGKKCPAPYVDDKKWQAFKRRIIIEEYTLPNDIVWELSNRGIISDKDGMLKEMAENPTGRLYWLARKAVQYIRQH